MQRDIEGIGEIYQIDISYNASQNLYRIESEGEEGKEVVDRMFDSFDIFNALTQGKELSAYIDLENSRARGAEHLFGLLHAVKNNVEIQIQYRRFTEEGSFIRTMQPYLLKEFKNRWYVIGLETESNRVKTFGLDRIFELEITTVKFQRPTGFDFRKYFHDCFGIIRPTENKPEKIILAFDTETGEYIKSKPLHHSQTILVDDDRELKISLFVNIEEDFIMELLSYGDCLKVIEPQSLIEYLQNNYRSALGQYT